MRSGWRCGIAASTVACLDTEVHLVGVGSVMDVKRATRVIVLLLAVSSFEAIGRNRNVSLIRLDITVLSAGD